MFTSFAGKLIAVLVTIILGMTSYWMHHITSMSTANSASISELQQEQSKVATELRLELRSISSQLTTLNAQVGALGEFTPRNGRLPR